MRHLTLGLLLLSLAASPAAAQVFQPAPQPGAEGFGEPQEDTGTFEEAEEGAGAVIEEEDKPTFKRAPFMLTGPNLPREIEGIETAPWPAARLRQLDKITGETRTVEIAAGREARVQRLMIRLTECRAPEDGSDRGTLAHLEIRDAKAPDRIAFTGWMFADSPALSALDHPRFDVWVISCTTSEG